MSGNKMVLLGGSQAPAVDPYFYSVTSLIHGDGTNGGQNNTFLDSSTNNFTITRNGNTTQGSFSPFSQTGWSNYFDGSSNLVTTASQVIPTGSFTIEAWAFVTSSSATQTILAQGTGVGDAGRTWIGIESSSGAKWAVQIGGTQAISSLTPVLNSWTHVAMTYNGSTITLYVNGISVASASVTQNASNTTLKVGANWGAYNLTGYVSNARVSNSVIYTSNFTPSTSPFSAAAGTVFLSCQSNRFVDKSSNAYAITTSGTPSVHPFSPLNPTTAYSTSSIGGSGYFDGSGDYLIVPHNAAFDFGSGDFTMEAWVYPTTTSLTSELFDKRASAANYSQMPQIQITANQPIAYASATGSSWAVTINGSSNVTPYSWNHVALTRSGNTWTLWLNGASIGTATSSITVYASTSNVVIGAADTAGTNPMNGYISGSRIVKGTAIYTAAFTPPTAPLTAVSGTSLLLNYTNGVIFDNAAVSDYETVGNAQISTSVKKYGTGSLAFDGTGDWLVAPASPSWDFGSGDFTVELWVNPSVITASEALVSKGNASSVGNEVWTLQWYGTNQLAFFSGGGLGTPVVTTGSIFATGNWYHVAVCRTAGVTKIFVNGTEQGTSTTSYTITAGGALYVGAGWYAPASRDISGYIDDLRITKGIARYPYSFTPPTAAFPDIGGTVTLTADPYYEYTTLLLPGNGTNGAQNNTFLDSSTNAFTITRNGNTTQGTFSPFSQTGWGNYFDGSGDYLSGPTNNAVSTFTGDFTIESWCYFNSIAADNTIAVCMDAAAGEVGWIFRWKQTATQGFRLFSSAIGTFDFAYVPSIGQWFHVAISRSGTSLRCFVNGTQIGTTQTASGTIVRSSVNPLCVGGGPYQAPSTNGYLSNVRIVNGTAVYTADFTPPTAPLTAITNTSLLTCQSNRFVDNSTNAFAITRNGDVSVQAFSPFNPTASWSAATYGGSGYFDGSGDYLSLADNAAFQYGTGDFTIEFWFYMSATAGSGNYYVLYDGRPSGTSGAYVNIAINNATPESYVSGSTVITGSALSANTWYHFAYARSGTSTKMFVNGTQVGSTYTDTTNYVNGTARPVIGTNGFSVGTSNFNGYFSNYRVVKGTAVYTANFTPPTTPLTAISGTSLLLNFTNAGIYDATSKNDLETVGNAQISTAQSKFGGSSMYFDGTGDSLDIVRSSNFVSNWDADFTIECWVYANNLSAQHIIFANVGTNSSGYNSAYINTNGSIGIGKAGVNEIASAASTFTSGQWNHLAFVRYGSNLNIYYNGVSVASTTSASTYLNSTIVGMAIGKNYQTTPAYMNGYIDDFRITKGIARYTSNFTPPTTAFLTL